MPSVLRNVPSILVTMLSAVPTVARVVIIRPWPFSRDLQFLKTISTKIQSFSFLFKIFELL